MGAHHDANEREADAGALQLRGHLGIEQGLDDGGLDPRPVVLDRDDDETVSLGDRDLHLAATLAEGLHGVLHEVRDRPDGEDVVAANHVREADRRVADAHVGRNAHGTARARDELRDVRGVAAYRGAASEPEHRLDHPLRFVELLRRRIEVTGERLGIGSVAAREVERRRDHRERVLELVGERHRDEGGVFEAAASRRHDRR